MFAPLRERLSKYNVIWDSPSRDASGSMPLGNGDIGINVWVEAGGDLMLLLGKNDAWDENSSLLKLGRIRVKLSPNPFELSAPFKQTLWLEMGAVRILAFGVEILIWVDANRPVVHCVVDGTTPIDVSVTVEDWRQSPYTIKTQTGDIFKNLTGPDPAPTIVSPDHVLNHRDRIVWWHQNERRGQDGFEMNLRLQGLGEMLGRMPHPLAGRTFGAAVVGDNFVSVNQTTIRSAMHRNPQYFGIHALTMHPASIEEWKRQLDENIDAGRNTHEGRNAHEQWWKEFWERSFVDSPVVSDLFPVARAHILQRFINACAGRGEFPIKHNGSIFSYGKPEDPDFRRWGAGYWFMNQRLIYWPMLGTGDFDLMRNWFAMYRHSLELQRHRTRTYFKHGGAHYPETIFFWGAEVSAHYGWIPFEQRERPEAECPYLTYYWSGGIELVLMMLLFYEYTGDESFARETLLPVADAVTEFFDLHYPRDANGKIRFEPAQALETWHDATNPLPELAGLRYTLTRLVESPLLSPLPVLRERVRVRAGEGSGPGKRMPSPPPSPGVPGEGESLLERWTRMLSELPPIPVGEKDGNRVVLPAERFDKKKNTENPELYCIFPYRLFGVGKPDLELVRDTFAVRLHQSHTCWSQDDIQMALLGLTDQAKEWITKRASPENHSENRFPGFWNAFKDWCPYIDHGGVLQLALQFMLMQCEDRKILLLPAWPMEWDVDFKLHAPFQTVVEAEVRGGKVVELNVPPASRRAVVQVCV
jgi:hypothetical protein